MESREPWMDEADALRAARPRTILFMCVANSARSQMAEGLARALAPRGVRVLSAGSMALDVNPTAMQVMREIGMDISSQHSKGLDEIPLGEVDAVVTLCAQEVCPVVPGIRVRVHWAMPDPTFAAASAGGTVKAFRGIRDSIRERLAYLFRDWPA